jgi:hypothetical protein
VLESDQKLQPGSVFFFGFLGQNKFTQLAANSLKCPIRNFAIFPLSSHQLADFKNFFNNFQDFYSNLKETTIWLALECPENAVIFFEFG